MSNLTSKVKDGWARWKLAHFFMRDLQDVDVSTTLPTSGQALLWNGTDNKWEPGTSGGFDPNEDPVIIGAGATAGLGSTPSSPAAGGSGSVAIGLGATASDAAIASIAIGSGATSVGRGVSIGTGSSGVFHDMVAIGYGAKANAAATSGIGAVAIGRDAQVGASGQAGQWGVAVGNGAHAYTQAVAVGVSAVAQAANAVGIGPNVQANWASSTALGDSATTTAAHQVMLGTSLETVVMPGNFDGSHLPTVNPGAGSGLVWSNAGVLTVA